MPSADAAWLRMDRPTNLMIINAVLLFDEPIDWPRVKDLVNERLVNRYPRFRQRAVESGPLRGGAFWEDDPHFDLDVHMHGAHQRRAGQLSELLPDSLVAGLPRDVAVSGVNVVERDGVSHRHPARFVLVGSMNPEEG